MAFTVAVIGAGELGSRHVQALAKTNIPLHLYVIDPFVESLRKAEARFREVPPNPFLESTYFLTDISQMPSFLDLAIIATTSKIRAKVITKLLSTHQVSFLLIEKILFPSLQEYDTVSKLLDIKKIMSWVNCSKRSLPSYQGVKKLFEKDKKIYFMVSGGCWGFATNLIQYLDYFSYLTGCLHFPERKMLLDENHLPSKREGYIELNGSFFAATPTGSHCLISSHPDSTAPRVLTIQGTAGSVQIHEEQQTSWIATPEGKWIPQEKVFPVPFQSDLTQHVARDILLKGTCNLPTFAESVQLHTMILPEFISFWQKKTGSTEDFCPVT